MEVVVSEENAATLPELWSRQVRGRTLITLDAHLDLQQVGPQRLRGLESCDTAAAVRALGKAHHLLPDGDSAYGLEDWIYPAHRLGLIDRLIWVAPPHVETGFPARAIEQIRQMDGVTADELAGAERKSDGRVEVRLLGLDVTVCRLQQLAGMPLPADALIDIDTDFFVAVPGDTAWIDPKEVFDRLRKLPARPGWITICRSVGSGFNPLRYRFLADSLAALWEGRERDAAPLERLFQLDRELQAGAADAVITGCRRLLHDAPDCAAAWYLLGLAEPDPAQAEWCRRRAADQDDAYRPDLLRAAGEYPNRQLPVTGAALRGLERQLAGSEWSGERKALAHAALGLIWCAGGHLSRAVGHYRECARQWGAHPELALEIGKRMLASPQPREAVPFLEAARGDDKTRTTARFLLGQLYLSAGSPATALPHLEAAHRAAPAWSEIGEALDAVRRRLGESGPPPG